MPATADESGREAAADTSSSDGTASSPEVAEAGNTRPGDEAEVSASGPADEATGTDAQGHTDTASGTETQGDQNDGADAIAQNDADGPVLPMARLITSARPPSRPVSPDPAFTFAAGAGIGVLTGLALAFLAGALGTRGQDAYYVVDDEEPGRG